MTISAKVIAHSTHSDSGYADLITLQLCYPRFIHAEFMTHRVFSRNASSSRAIPIAKMIEQVRENPAMPIHWGKNQPGMQANEELGEDDREFAQGIWVTASRVACDLAETMSNCGAHKQVVNRILEPFQHIHVVVTATDWDNFFELRDHKDAQPEISELAVRMKEAIKQSLPVTKFTNNTIEESNWHLPYVTLEEKIKFSNNAVMLAKLSAARCARVSYLTHDGAFPDIDKDLQLFERLMGSRPVHASPVEHQAFPMKGVRSNNFRDWKQFREVLASTDSQPK